MINKCCMFTESGCKGLKDSAFVKYVKEGKCGTIKCPFFKTEKSQIRRGDELIDGRRSR